MMSTGCAKLSTGNAPAPRHGAGAAGWVSSNALLAVLAILSLVGCRTTFPEYIRNGFKVGPNYSPPAAAVSPEWIDYHDKRIVSADDENFAWWRLFNDPVLDELVRRSHDQNLTLREAGFRVLEARALRGIAVGNLFPQQQNVNGSYTRTQVSFQSFNAGGVGIPRAFDVWRAGGALGWELDFWGRFRRSIEAANADLDASIEDFDNVLVILVSDVAAAYVEVRTVEQRLRYARGNVQSQTGSLNIAEAKQQEGVASRLDVAQAKTNVAQTEAIIPQLEVQLRQAQNRLCVLMGIPPQDLAELLGPPRRIPTAPPHVAIGVPADLIRRRPDVRRAERIVAGASARIGISEADLYPAFSINGTIFVQALQFPNLFQDSALGGTIGPAFNWNVLNYGRLLNAVDAREARFGQAVAAYQNLVLNANREAENSIVAFLRFQEQARILRVGVEAAEESRDLVNELYRGGRADFNRVFVAELFLTQQQDALAQSEGAIAQAMVSLYRAIGGGWQLRLQELPPLNPADYPPLTPQEAGPPPAPDRDGELDPNIERRPLPPEPKE